MALRLRVASPLLVLVSGMDLAAASHEAWRQALNSFGTALQSKVANTFAAQRTAMGPLLPNDPAYTAWKIKHGHDPRRGHKDNILQSMLRPTASRLFFTVGPDRFGNGRIVFQEERLYSLVPYARYYAESKVRGGLILAIAQSWLRPAATQLYALDALAATQRSRPGVLSPAARAGLGLLGRGGRRLGLIPGPERIPRQLAAAQEGIAAKAAIGNRSVPIRRTVGLTNVVAGGLGSQALQGLSAAQRARAVALANRLTGGLR